MTRPILSREEFWERVFAKIPAEGHAQMDELREVEAWRQRPITPEADDEGKRAAPAAQG
jgi:hypothetical protein